MTGSGVSPRSGDARIVAPLVATNCRREKHLLEGMQNFCQMESRNSNSAAMARLILFCLAAIAGAALGADSPLTVDPRELPRFPPVEPDRAVQTFIVKRG